MQNADLFTAWLKERAEEMKAPEAKRLNEAKVIFLGDGESGKTLSIARLMNEGVIPEGFDGESTPGIQISHKSYPIDGEDVLIHYWDFGGQEMMHSMHRMFLTLRTLYVVFVNVRENTQDERARYWVHNIKNFANGSRVILVLNKIDQNPNATINANGLHKLYDGLDGIVRLSALEDSPEDFNSKLRDAILTAVKNMESRVTPFPNTWSLLKTRLDQMESYYINRKAYLELCDTCGVKGDAKVLNALVDWMGDLGVCFCYRSKKSLSDFMILNPRWITNAIYILLFNGKDSAHNGIISHDDIFELLQEAKINGRKVKSVLEIKYENSEINYILGVIRNFFLCYQIDEDHEFVPMLCENNELEITNTYQNYDDIQEFVLEYEYLPINVFHRFLVEMHGYLSYDHVWLTGAEFVFRSFDMTALVMSVDNAIHIYIKNNSYIYKSGDLLPLILDCLDRINKTFQLQPDKRVIYKEGGISDDFDYEELVEALGAGQETQYSRKFHKSLSIRAIINNAGADARNKEQVLLHDMLQSCLALQSFTPLYHAGEDARNTYIRNELRARKYIVHDQTFEGVSAFGLKPGELDLLICSEPEKPIAIFEALNLKSFEKTGREYWEQHLKKLLDNYNPRGLRTCFLVSYVEKNKESFYSFYEKYQSHVRAYSFDACTIIDAREKIMDSNYCRVDIVNYNYAGYPIRVYNICLRIG